MLKLTKRKEEVELRNEADQLVFTTEKTVKDLKEKSMKMKFKKPMKQKMNLKKQLRKMILMKFVRKKMHYKKLFKTYLLSYMNKLQNKHKLLVVQKVKETWQR